MKMSMINPMTIFGACLVLFAVESTLVSQDLEAGRQFLRSSDSYIRMGYLAKISAQVGAEHNVNVEDRLNLSTEILQKWDKIQRYNLAAGFITFWNADIDDNRIKRVNAQILEKLSRSQVKERSNPHFGGIPRDEYVKPDLLPTFLFCMAARNHPKMRSHIADAVEFAIRCKKSTTDNEHEFFDFYADAPKRDSSELNSLFYSTIMAVCLITEFGTEENKLSIENLKQRLTASAKERIRNGKLSYHDFYVLSIAISSKTLNLAKSDIAKLKEHFAGQQKEDGSWQGDTFLDKVPQDATSLCLMAFKNLADLD